jgi:TolB-like protein
MPIWSAEIKELETLHTSIKGRFPELEKELNQLIKTEDTNVALLYSRRCLEVIVTELCESELKRPRKTEPLKGIIDKLHHEEKIPSHIIASMQNLNTLSTFGAHPKEFDSEQVRPVLINLTTIIKWYIKYKDIQTIRQPKPLEEKSESKEPVEVAEGIKKSKKRLILLLSGILLAVVIIVVALFVFNIIGDKKETKEIEKSIAVLPFINDSPDEENTYFINGIMDEILINLQTIKDLRVISRNSVEQYRGPDKPSTPEIAKSLNVNYVVEGSGQKYGNIFVLRVQLLEGSNDRHLWGESYEQRIDDIEDIIKIQSQIAQAIAIELKAVITPEEKQLIEKTPTPSLTAYDYYQRGREEYQKYLSDNDNREVLGRAEDLYHKALECDSAFALAYTGLARVYYVKHYWEAYYSEEFLDSILILADIALFYDNQLAEAYTIRGHYYYETGKPELALQEYDKALKINSNYWETYYGKGMVYWNNDLLKTIDNYQKAASLNRGSELPALLRRISLAYVWSGFKDKGNYHSLEALKLDGDSVSFLSNLSISERWNGNFNKSIEFGEKAFAIDSTNIGILFQLGCSYSYSGQHKESFKYFKKLGEILESSPEKSIQPGSEHRIGYAYWENGYKKEAEYFLNKALENSYMQVKLSRGISEALVSYYDIAAGHAFRGERNKAYENLMIFNQKQIMPLWVVTLIKIDPLFDSIRDEEEFQQIVRDVEAKYQAEHERVRKWLEESDLSG